MADKKISELTARAVADLNDSDSYIVESGSLGTGRATLTNIKTKMLGNSNISQLGETTVTGAINALNYIVNYANSSAPNAGIRNSIARGRSKGSSVSATQWASIQAGTFEDMYIGDYWASGGVVYRIAAFDYYYGKKTSDHHIVIVPDTLLESTKRMHSSADNSGGYVSTEMYTTTIPAITTPTIFSGHILNVSKYLSSAVSTSNNADGVVTGITAATPSMTLMTHANVFGWQRVFTKNTETAAFTGDDDTVQYPLFRLCPHLQRVTSNRYWLRDPFTGTGFLVVMPNGTVQKQVASTSTSCGVRPAFCIYNPST